MNKKEFMITHEVYKELLHHFPDEIDFFQNISIFPKINQVCEKYVKQGFDLADASLLEYSEIKGYTIITEDQPMLLENIIDGSIKVIHLTDYFGIKMIEGVISQTELYRIIKKFRSWRIISKRSAKKILNLRSSLK